MTEIDINGNFNRELSKSLVPELRNAVYSNVRGIDINITSTGGYMYVADQIVDLMEVAKANGIIVATYVSSHAYSAASYVAVAGSPGHRYVSPTAEYLIHYGTAGAMFETPKQLRRVVEHNERHFQRLFDHYKKHCKIPNLRGKMEDDSFYFTAADALKWGVADEEMYSW